MIRRVELPFGEVEAHAVFSAYVHAVAGAGTVPVVLPCIKRTWAESLVAAVDGVVLTGGPDVAADHARDAAEIAMVHASLAMGRPVLGVCRGLQIVNVALGGSLVTNSLHHQAAGKIGARLRVTARAADGTVEALESDGPAPVLAVQWHPELDAGPAASAPFAWLAARAEAARCS